MTGELPPVRHGGDLARAEAEFGPPAEVWLDLSTGINPQAYPVVELSHEAWSRLPDSGVMLRLKEAAAGAYGVEGPARIAAAPGSSAIIQWLPRLAKRTRVAVLGPAYAEHAAAWRAAGHMVDEVEDLEEISKEAAVVVVVNPNNPTGRYIESDGLVALARSLGERHGLLVVDEAFADVAPEGSLACRAGLPGLVVLRSFGKFYGLAGVRLGFALAWQPLVEALERLMGPWAVPGPAAALASVALADETWKAATRNRLAADAHRLRELIGVSGLKVLGGTDLFVLAGIDRAEDLHAHLAKQGILVRRFPERPTWLRFGLPPDARAWERLEGALKSWPGMHKK